MNVSDLIGPIAARMHKEKSKWLDECMHRILPADICVNALSEKGRHRMKASKYIVKIGLRLAEYPDKTQIQVKGETVAEFAAGIKDGKFQITTRTLPPDIKCN